MKRIELTYYITFGKGDFNDDMLYEFNLSDEQYKSILNLIKPQNDIDFDMNKEYDFEILSQDVRLRDLGKIIYEDIVETATKEFLETEDLEDWGLEDEVDNPDWKIDNTFDVTIRSFKFLDN